MTQDGEGLRRWTRATVYGDMWVDPVDDPREVAARAPDEVPDERAVLVDYLRRYRLTPELKCDGLRHPSG
jgi:hypothetical protein